MTSTAPARDPEVRLGQLKVLAGLLPYLWPTGRGDLKARVAVAVVFLVLAKLATVTVPLVLKEAVDALTPAGAVETAAGLASALPLALRSEEHTSALQSLMRTSYAVCCWK